ncbi:hypothetical protein SGLAM104S_05354 [Streptomyces glaucescens]
MKAWGQTDAPTDATAVFPPDAVPASHSGSALTAADYKRADVIYMGASAHEVNAATPVAALDHRVRPVRQHGA